MNRKPKIIKKSYIFILIAVLSLLVMLGCYFYYRQEAEAIRQEKQNDLKAIAFLKVHQLVQWRQERIADATVISGRPFFIKRVEQWLIDKNEDGVKKSINKDLRTICNAYNYEAVILSSVNRKPLISYGYTLDHFDNIIADKIIQAVNQQQVICTDFYCSELENKIFYDVIAPLVNNEKKIIAVVILRMNPQDYLYPVIQSWPTPSKSAETLIVRQEGDSVLFLNELRHRKNTALRLRIPLSKKQTLAVQAVLGSHGIMEGKDYRGADVVADIRSVANTPWYMIVKVDKSEILKNLYVESIYIILFSLLIILVITTGIYLIYHSRQRDMYRNLWQSQEKFKTTLYSIGDAIITTDKQGMIQHMNPVAQQLTGWSESKARGKKLEKVFRIINESNRKELENPVKKIQREGTIVELANYSLLISRDGKEIPIAESASSIKDEKGNIIGVVLVFRDQTKERKAKRSLEKSERLYKEAQNVAHIGHWELDPKIGTPVWSEEIFRIFGLDPEKGEPSFTDHETLVHPDDWPLLNKSVTKAGQDGTPYNIEFRIIRPNKEIRWMHAIGTTTEDEHGKVVKIFGTVQDVTSRKRAEEKLRQSEMKFRTLFETMAQGVVYQDAEGNITSANPAAE
ncbi:MAG: PAS domain S-box protein [bacterium]